MIPPTAGFSASAPRLRRAGGEQVIPRPAEWAPGRPSPWRAAADNRAPLTVDEILAVVPPVDPDRPWTPESPDARASAVLVALLDGPQGAEVLLTRRSRHLSIHRGEISFPGGRMDAGETPVTTAAREAWEEVGLAADLFTVHGELDHLNTMVSKSYIVPIVARLHERPELTPSPAEVERVLFVPLAELVRADTHREELWSRGAGGFTIEFFELDDETIWGATGRMLFQLLCLAYGVTP